MVAFARSQTNALVPALAAFIVAACLVALPSAAMAQTDDPCIEKLGDDPERQDQYDKLVQDYLDASAASDSDRQVALIDELLTVCDANLRLWVFRANAYAAQGKCDEAVKDFEFVLERADGWWAAENAADAKAKAEEGMERHAASCRATLRLTCESDGSFVTVGDLPERSCPAEVSAPPGLTKITVRNGEESVTSEHDLVHGMNTIHLDSGGGSTGGGGAGESPAEESGMAIDIGAGIIIGPAWGREDDGDDSTAEADFTFGFGGGARAFASFQFASFMGVGIIVGFDFYSHPDDSETGVASTTAGKAIVKAANLGLLARFEFGIFSGHAWISGVFGTLTFESEDNDSLDTDLSGVEVGLAPLFAIDFGAFSLDIGPQVSFRNASAEIDLGILGIPGLTTSIDVVHTNIGVMVQGVYEIGL